MEASFSQLLRLMREEHRWRRTFKKSLCAELDALGDSAREVSSKLVASGVRGTPRDAKDCAIARYLGAIIGGDCLVTEIEVTARRLEVSTTRRSGPIVVDLPPAICSFVAAFDRLAYPELVQSLAPPNELSQKSPVTVTLYSSPTERAGCAGSSTGATA